MPARPTPATPEALLETFATRLDHAYAPKTARQYRWGLGDILKLAAERRGRPISLLELFEDCDLLGSILTSTARAGGGPEVAGWTVPARRSAAYAAASLLAPELRAGGIAEPRWAVDAALRLLAERVGNRYRLPKPLTRNYGRGSAPSAAEVDAVIQAAESDPGWRGPRDSALFQTMFFTAARVNAVRELDGAAVQREPDGGGRMLVHAKYWKDSGEFLIPATVMMLIDAYATAFNLWATARGLSARVGIGVPGPLWRSRRGMPVSYSEINRRLTEVCAQASIARYTPHAFRYAFATLGTEVAPRFVVAMAGGWTGGPRLMDEHYVHRDIDAALAKVAAMKPRRSPDDSNVRPIHQPVGVG